MPPVDGKGLVSVMFQSTANTALTLGRRSERDYMLVRIKILGYLSLHTRQLDMIMSNPVKVRYYGHKLQADIEELLKPAAGPADN